jgi:amino acid transporter
MDDNKKSWLTPTGAGIALICFFLPWIEFSCGDIKKSISGAELGGIFWVVCGAAVLSLLAYFYFKNSSELGRAKPVVILSALMAMTILIYKYFDFKSGTQNGLEGLSQLSQMPNFQSNSGEPMKIPEMAFSLRFGGYGTIVGFMMTLIGGFFLEDQETSRPARKVVISYYQEAGNRQEKVPTQPQ